MKITILNTILLIIAFLSFISSINSQTQIDCIINNRDDMFPGNPDSGVKPVFWNNGILYLGFCVDEQESRYGITLMFYDTIGNLNWSKKYLNPSYSVYSGYDILTYNNSSFYIVGACRETWNSNYQSLFIKYNNEGDSIFSIIYPDSANKAILCVDKFSEDTILLCSKWDEDLSGDQKIVIEKVDTNGIVHDTYTSEYENINPEQILKTPSDLILVAGRRITDYGNIKVYINVYDLSLNYLYMVNPCQTPNEYFGGLTIMNNEVYMSSKIQVSNPQPYWDRCKINRLSSLGYVQATTYISSVLWEIGLSNIITLNDNCMVVPISSWYLPHNSTFYFLDTNMSVICSTYIEYPTFPDNKQWFGNIAPIPGNRIAGSGMFWPDPNYPNLTQDHWNFLTTSVEDFINTNCNYPTTGEGVIEEKKDKLKIYPNPFRNTITIENNNEDLFDSYVIVYDCSGIIVFTSGINNEDLKINLNFLPKGLYFIRIFNEEFQEIRKIFKN